MRNFISLFRALTALVIISMCNFSFAQGEDNVNTSSDSDDRLKIRLGFTAVNSIYRQILLTVDDRASMGYDWGFDGPLNDIQTDDMSWLIDDEKYVIQGIDNINIEETYLPLALKKGDEGMVIISIDELENVPNELEIYLHDLELDEYHDLRDSNYEINLSSGDYNDKYRIVFQQQESSLSTTENELDQLSFYYAMNRNKMVILNPNNTELKGLEIYNTAGQSVYINNNIWEGSYNEYDIQNLSSGVYIVKLDTANNNVLTKKIIVK